MPLDKRATETTATNSATYLVNKRRRVLGIGTSVGAPCCCAPSIWTAGCFPPNPCMKLLILIMTPRRSASCVDGPRLARDNLTCSTEIACSHVSGLLVQPKPTAGPDGVREPRPHHSNGINLPPKRQASLGCV